MLKNNIFILAPFVLNYEIIPFLINGLEEAGLFRLMNTYNGVLNAYYGWKQQTVMNFLLTIFNSTNPALVKIVFENMSNCVVSANPSCK